MLGPALASRVGRRLAVEACSGEGAGHGLAPGGATSGIAGATRGRIRGAVRGPAAAGTENGATCLLGGITALLRATDPAAGPALGGGPTIERPVTSRGADGTMALAAPCTRENTEVGGRDPGRGRGAEPPFA